MNYYRPPSLRQQRGLSLIVVMVIVLLSGILAVWTGRVANFNEIRAGNDSDYQRAVEAAQAMMLEAQLDITMGSTALTQRLEGYRINVNDPDEMANLLTDAEAGVGGVKCKDAVCSDLSGEVFGDPAQVFWNKPTTRLQAFWNTGAKYGQYTGNGFQNTPNKNANPRLIEDPNVPVPAPQYVQGAKYWIEILFADKPNAGWAQECVNAASDANYLFRITAIAMGRGGRPAVIQEVFVLNPGGLDVVRRCPSA